MDKFILVLPLAIYVAPLLLGIRYAPPQRLGFAYYVLLTIPLVNIAAAILARNASRRQ